MRVDSFSMGTHSLQSSDNNRIATEEKTVGQDNEKMLDLMDEKEEKVTAKKVETAVNKINDFIEPLKTNLKFEYHEKLHEYYVTIVNPNTDEVIKEIPPKKMLDMYASMAEYMGFLIDKKI